ncbi:MAG: NAD(P)H-binding protein [Nitratireductor sp.]
MLGATGTIGRATAAALVRRGHEVVCLVRPKAGPDKTVQPNEAAGRLPGCEIRVGEAADPHSLRADGFRGEAFDAVVSCMASRSGRADDAWAIDHRAHLDALAAAEESGVGQFVLLSAICVQKPALAFQHAKRAFEDALIASALDHSIVRPTAYFKSLSGQIARVKAGKPFLVFGDGELTACKPISDADLGDYIAGCLSEPDRRNRILPIGGPGAPITPRAQAEMLEELLGRPVKVKRVPIGLMDAMVRGLSLFGKFSPRLAGKAELARIGRYYATESMLVWDSVAGRYDADATPEYGRDRLIDHYRRVLAGEESVDLGDHAVF